MSVHLVTGATGFLGSALMLELLSRTNDQLVGLVRATADNTPESRLRQVLHGLVPAYDLPASLHAAIDARVTAVAGDVWEPRCGVAHTEGLEGAVLWHCAASLQYQDRHREQIVRTNVQGAQHVVDLAHALNVRVIHMFSTAYVAGRSTGVIAPARIATADTNNHYEASKIEAERVLADSGLPVLFMRPGIVIGHSQTRHALNYNGMYGFVRGVTKFRRALDRAQPGLSERLECRLRVDVGSHIGLVPIDHVVSDAVGLFLHGAQPGYYHLTNPSPPPTSQAIEVAFRLAGLKTPLLMTTDEELTSLDRKLQQAVDFYNSYLLYPKTFDRSTTAAVLGDQLSPGLPMGEPELLSFMGWYVDVLRAEGTEATATR